VTDRFNKARGFRSVRFFVFPVLPLSVSLIDGRFKYAQVAPPSPTLPSPTV
jgi:hypothetical protein